MAHRAYDGDSGAANVSRREAALVGGAVYANIGFPVLVDGY